MKASVASDGQVLLSPGEYRFMTLLCQGYSRPQIAARTCVEVSSLRTFASRTRSKLHCQTMIEAAIKFKTVYVPNYGYRYSHCNH